MITFQKVKDNSSNCLACKSQTNLYKITSDKNIGVKTSFYWCRNCCEDFCFNMNEDLLNNTDLPEKEYHKREVCDGRFHN